LGGKLDHKFEIWQVDWTIEADAAPTLNDEPASSWTTAELRAEHEGDFIILSDGRCFQFSAVGQTYEWKEVSDKYLIDYVTMIGSKSSVFNGSGMRESQIPTNYKANDIWVNCQYHDNSIDYRDEILVAVRDFTGAASISDWTTTNNYKADVASYKEAIENIVAKYDIQPDGKHETYFVDYDTTQYSSIAALLSAIEANWIAQHPDQDAEDVKKEHIGDLCYVKPYTGYPDGRLYEYTRRLVEADGYDGMDTIVLDSWSVTQKLLKAYTFAHDQYKGKVCNSTEDYGYSTFPIYAYKNYTRLANALLAHVRAGRDVVIVAHAVDDTVPDANLNDMKQWQFDAFMMKSGKESIRHDLFNSADQVWFMTDGVMGNDKKKASGGCRLVYLQCTPEFWAKSRTHSGESCIAVRDGETLPWEEILGRAE
jgi:hypothetical protein